jgi:hypothetical protein
MEYDLYAIISPFWVYNPVLAFKPGFILLAGLPKQLKTPPWQMDFSEVPVTACTLCVIVYH